MGYKILFSWLTLFFLSALNAQNPYHITHTSGTRIVNGIAVTVKHKGIVETLQDLSYCNGETGPFYFGTDYSRRYGSYTLTFSPPIDGLTLNFTGLTASDNHMEEIQLFINGAHYAIPNVGTKMNCEELAVLTSKGNIRPCQNCGVSGWKGTKIKETISELTVADTILSGAPGGVLFALYIGNPVNEPLDDYTAIIKIFTKDIIAGKGFTVSSTLLSTGTIELVDKDKNIIVLDYYPIDDEKIFVDASLLKPGYYNLTITSGEEIEKQKIIIN